MAIGDVEPRSGSIPFTGSAPSQRYPATVINPFGPDYDGEPRIEHAFRNAQGDTIFSTDDVSHWYVMPKGSHEAYAIKQRGFGGNSEQFETSFSTDLSGSHEIKLTVDARGARMDNEPLTPLNNSEKAALLASSRNGKTSFVGIPEVRSIEESVRLPNGNYMIVSANETDYQYGTLRMYEGPSLNNLREVPMTDVNRLRDGGTTYYKTNEGTLFVPTPLDQGVASTWTPAGSQTAMNVQTLNRDAISRQIGNSDPRLVGAQTWEQHLAPAPAPAAAAPAPAPAAAKPAHAPAISNDELMRVTTAIEKSSLDKAGHITNQFRADGEVRNTAVADIVERYLKVAGFADRNGSDGKINSHYGDHKLSTNEMTSVLYMAQKDPEKFHQMAQELATKAGLHVDPAAPVAPSAGGQGQGQRKVGADQIPR